MIANMQVQSCNVRANGMFANFAPMELQNDRELIQSLSSWSSLSPSEIARRAGLTPSTLTRPLNHPVKHRLSVPTLDKLRETFPDFPGFRSLPDIPAAPTESDFVFVEVLPSFAGMGGGGTGDGDRMLSVVPRQLIEVELHGRPADFRLINVRGDSMMPMFEQGDQLLIDLRDRDPIQPGPFALFDGDAYFVKLVERAAGRRGWYRVFSANPRYADDIVEEAETTIMGRPVWFARRL